MSSQPLYEFNYEAVLGSGSGGPNLSKLKLNLVRYFGNSGTEREQAFLPTLATPDLPRDIIGGADWITVVFIVCAAVVAVVAIICFTVIRYDRNS